MLDTSAVSNSPTRGRAGYGERARGRAVGPGFHRSRGRAGQLLVVARVVGEGHHDTDGLAFVGVIRRIAVQGLSRYVHSVGLPLVVERRVDHPVYVGDAGQVRRQLHAHPGNAGDGGQTRGRVVGLRLLGLGLHGVRRRAGQFLLITGVVGEGHSDAHGLPHVVSDRRVGRIGRVLGLRAVGLPLVAEHGVRQAVRVGDARRVRCQRLPHLGRAADGTKAGGRGVGRRSRVRGDCGTGRCGPRPAAQLPVIADRLHPVGVEHALLNLAVGPALSDGARGLAAQVLAVGREGAARLRQSAQHPVAGHLVRRVLGRKPAQPDAGVIRLGEQRARLAAPRQVLRPRAVVRRGRRGGGGPRTLAVAVHGPHPVVVGREPRPSGVAVVRRRLLVGRTHRGPAGLAVRRPLHLVARRPAIRNRPDQIDLHRARSIRRQVPRRRRR